MFSTTATASASRDDRRVYPRAGVDGEVWVHRFDRREALPEPGARGPLGVPHRLANLSFGGAKFVGHAACGGVGERVELALPAMGRDNILVVGRIVRVEQTATICRTAVNFDQVSVADQLRLARVLSVLLARPANR